MKRLSKIAAVALSFGLAMPLAFAKPQTKTATKNSVKATAKNIVKDRSGNEAIQLVLANLHRTEGRTVSGTVKLTMKGADVKECAFATVIDAAKEEKPAFDCYGLFDDFTVDISTADVYSGDSAADEETEEE
jgi:hypothetical protein